MNFKSRNPIKKLLVFILESYQVPSAARVEANMFPRQAEFYEWMVEYFFITIF